MKKQDQLLVFYNNANLLHKSSKPHPESPQRLIPTISSFKKLTQNIGSQKINVQHIEPSKGIVNVEKTQKLIQMLHGENYWEFVKEMWYEGISKPEMFINKDTYFMKDTYFAAIQAARTTLIATQALINSSETSKAFAFVRPPGHHSGMKSQPHGFSFFNNLALSVAYTLEHSKHKKIAIVDWDVHHGEGTQKLFYSNNQVLFVSLHRYDEGKFFPHIKQSSSQNVGSGEGLGFNVNICWDLPTKKPGEKFEKSQTCGDEEYVYAFDKIVIPILKQYDPDIIFVSCGFDSAKGDQIGGLLIEEPGYTYMTKRLMEFEKNILFVLQGGYNSEVLVWATQTVLRALTSTTKPDIDKIVKTEYEEGKCQANKIGKKGVEVATNNLKKYWNCI